MFSLLIFIVFILGSHVLYCFIYPLVNPLIYPLERGRNIDCRATLSVLSLIISPCFRAHPCSSVVGILPTEKHLSAVMVLTTDCTDLHRTKDIYIVFPCPSVFIRGWHTSSHAPRRFRHIPDTYPIHTRHIPDTYVYPMNTPRIPRVYPMNTPTIGKKAFAYTLRLPPQMSVKSRNA